jgi:hypothetical protein
MLFWKEFGHVAPFIFRAESGDGKFLLNITNGFQNNTV